MNRLIVSILGFIFSIFVVSKITLADQVYRFLTIQEMYELSAEVALVECIGKDYVEEIGADGFKSFETRYLLKVIEVYKTNSSDPWRAGEERLVRFWGAPPSMGKREMLPYIREMPEFFENMRYVVFLRAPSKTSGLVSPLALEQSVQYIIKEKDGTLKMTNKFNNRGLFKETSKHLKGVGKGVLKAVVRLEEKEKGPVDYDTFTSILRGLGNQGL